MISSLDGIPEKMDVTDARPEDVREIMEIMREGWLERFVDESRGVTKEVVEDRFEGPGMEQRLSAMQDAIREGKEKYLVARAGGRIAGLLSFSNEEKENWVQRFFVRKEFRGTVALKLAAAAEARLDATKDTLLAVLATNESAIQLYRRFGFVEDDAYTRQLETSTGDVHSQDMIVMRRKARVV